MKNSAGPLPPFADLLLDSVFLVDSGGNVVYVNAACERMLGYTQEELIGRELFSLITPEDRAKPQAESWHVMSGQPRTGFENRYVHKNGHLVHLMWSVSWSEPEQLRIGVARDITELKRAQQMQAATYAISEAAHDATDLAALFHEIHRIIADLVSAAGFAVAIPDPDTKQLGFYYRIGFDPQACMEQGMPVLQHSADAILNGQPMELPASMPRPVDSEPASHHRMENWLILPLSEQNETVGALILKSHPGIGYSDKEKELLHFMCAQVATAIRRRQVHDELLRSAMYDELTGLPNRRLLYDRLRSALSRCKRKKERMALLFIDIDNFKKVNDSLGHATGDLLLQEVAVRLKNCLRDEDTVARLGGDEFVVLLEDIKVQENAWAIAEKIRLALHNPETAGGQFLQAAASIGIALYPEDGMEPEDLLQHADKKMYQAKKFGAMVPEA